MLGLELFLPLPMFVFVHAAHFEEFFLFEDELVAAEARYGISILQKYRFLGADFFAESAVDAAQHIELELFGFFFNVGVGGVGVNLLWRDANGLGRADELAQLAADALDAPGRVLDEGGYAAVVRGDGGLFLGVFERDGLLKGALERDP